MPPVFAKASESDEWEAENRRIDINVLNEKIHALSLCVTRASASVIAHIAHVPSSLSSSSISGTIVKRTDDDHSLSTALRCGLLFQRTNEQTESTFLSNDR
jgi:hypothetical protein